MVLFLLEHPVFLLGIFLTMGYIVSLYLYRLLSIPHIVTYLVTGGLLANFFLKELDLQTELKGWFQISQMIALGLIGFKIGTELNLKQLRKHPKFISLVTLSETGFSLIIVTLLIFAFRRDFLLALILGGLATATAPAATVEVFRKFKAKGPLTKRIKWLLAFDDIVAILIVEGVLVYLITLVGGDVSFIHYLLELAHEIGLALLIGLIVGYLLDIVIENLKDDIEMMELTLGVLILTIGISFYLQTSVIIATMTVGAVTTNRAGDNYKKSGELLEIIISPILMIFFVLVGTRLKFHGIDTIPWLALVYLVGRSVGKVGGAYLGARWAKSPDIIKNNVGLGLLAQGGVSLGLAAIVAEILLGTPYEYIGTEVVTLIVISTFFSVGLGSYGAKLAVKRAGELGKEIINKSTN